MLLSFTEYWFITLEWPLYASLCSGLLPIMLGGGTGSEVMRRIASPMVGGMVSAVILTLVVIPAVFLLWRSRVLAKE